MKKMKLNVKSKITALTILIFAGILYYNFEKKTLPGQTAKELFAFLFFNIALAFGAAYFVITRIEMKKKDNSSNTTEEKKDDQKGDQ